MSPAPAASSALDFDAPSWGVSDDLIAILRQGSGAVQHFHRPVTQTLTADLFANLAATWKDETAFNSSVDDIILHPAYQRIIGLGPKAIPLILADLGEAPAHWFWALNALTGITPFSIAENGDVLAMTAAWLQWGRERRLID